MARGDARGERGWKAFAHAQRTDADPSPATGPTSDWSAYHAHDPRADEVDSAMGRAKPGTAESPADNTRSEAIRRGGPALRELLRLGFAYVLRTGAAPLAWAEGYVTWLWKGKKDRLCWRSYRGIVLGSNMAKTFERVLLERLHLFVGRTRAISGWQAIGQSGVDTLSQVYYLHEAAQWRKARNRASYLLIADVAGAFPLTSRPLLWELLRRKGISGALLRVLQTLFDTNRVRLGLGGSHYTPAVDRDTGVAEGRVLSPLLFAFMVDELLEEVRAHGLGVSVGPPGEAAWCGGSMYMDDIGLLLDSPRDLRRATDVIRTWCWRRRYGLEMDKLDAMAILPGELPGPLGWTMRWHWDARDYPAQCGSAAAAAPAGPAGLRGAAAPGASGPIEITLSASVKLLGITIAHTLLWDEHALARVRAAGGYYAALGQSKAEFGTSLQRAHLHAGYASFGRSAVDWSCALWGWIHSGQNVDAKVDSDQRLSLLTAVGGGDAGKVKREALEWLFGELPPAIRHDALRAGLLYRLEAGAARCSERRAALDVFRADDDPHFTARAIITRLRGALGALALPWPDTAALTPAQFRRRAHKAAHDAAGAAWRRTLADAHTLRRLRGWPGTLTAAWRHELLRRPARGDGTGTLIAAIGGTCRLCPCVRATRYDWEGRTRCSPADAVTRRRTWLPTAHDDARAALGGCDWCGAHACDLGVPLADWEHIESGECHYFHVTVGVTPEWHRRAYATLASAGWPGLAARGAGSFAQRLGFGLPPRATLPAGAAPRRTTAAVRAQLIQDFADTFGRWDEEHPGAEPGQGDTPV